MALSEAEELELLQLRKKRAMSQGQPQHAPQQHAPPTHAPQRAASPAPQQPPQPKMYADDEVNPLAAIGIGGGQGVSAGHMDELGAKLDSTVKGTPYDQELMRARQLDSANKQAYPTLYGGARLAGSVFGPGKFLGKAGGAATFGQRMLGGIAGGSALGAAEGHGNSTDEDRSGDTLKGGLIGAVTGGIGQAVLGEPIRAGGRWLASRISSLDDEVSRRADEIIASAKGLRGKQHQEAAGARENLNLERMFAKQGQPAAQAAQPGPAQTVNLRVVNGGAAPARAPAPAPAAPSPASQVMANVRPSRLAEVEKWRLGNAERKINEAFDSPVQIPSKATAQAQVVGEMNAHAQKRMQKGAVALAGQALRGAGGALAGAGAAGPLGAAGGLVVGGALGNPFWGVRQIVHGALSSPQVMNRLRNIPGYGAAIDKSAAKGAIHLESTLYALAQRDPAVAKEIEAISAEVGASSRPEEMDEE